jgi:transposase
MQQGKRSLTDISDQELHAIYDSGREATVSFMRFLLDRIKSIEQTLLRQQDEIKNLKEQLAKNSKNSSKPPSSDGPFQAPKSLRKKSGKSVGGQKGHKGETLRMSETPDRIEELFPDTCERCHKSLQQDNVVGCEARQVFDIPKPNLEVTEYRAYSKECSHCDHVTAAKFPSTVHHKVQYGPNLRATMMYFRHQNYIPTERLAEIFSDVFNVHISEGTIINTTRMLGESLADFEASTSARISKAPIIHCDETGIKINGVLHWLHSASTTTHTAFMPHENRGIKAMADFGILPGYSGRVIHDAWPGYFDFDCLHGLCNAHHLRDLTFIHEVCGQAWAGKMIRLLLKIKEEASAAASRQRQIGPKMRKRFERRYMTIVREGERVNPVPVLDSSSRKRGRKKRGKARCLVDRLRGRRKDVLAFMYDTSVPFDNNLSERDIRMSKVHQKVSGGFRSMRGASDFCRIRGFISTVRKHGKNVLGFLVKVFQKQDIASELS